MSEEKNTFDGMTADEIAFFILTNGDDLPRFRRELEKRELAKIVHATATPALEKKRL